MRIPKRHTLLDRFLCPSVCSTNVNNSCPTHSNCGFVHIRRFSLHRYWHVFCFWKNLLKSFENHFRTITKSKRKTCWFSILFFPGLGIDFGRSWASKLEPSWPKTRSIISPSLFGSQLVMTGRFGEGLGKILAGFGAVLAAFGEGQRPSKERTTETIATIRRAFGPRAC